jgi:predicted metalloendopeptidase
MRSLVIAALCCTCAASACQPQPSPASSAHAPAAPATPQIDEDAIDPNVAPCDDFYAYACGKWLDSHTAPVTGDRIYRSFDAAETRNAALFPAFQAEVLAGKRSVSDADAKRVADFFASCNAPNRARALTTLLRELSAIGQDLGRTEFARLVAELSQAGAPMPVAVLAYANGSWMRTVESLKSDSWPGSDGRV